MSKTTYEILFDARELLRKGWCQRAYARAGLTACRPYDPNATSWCLLGAVLASVGEEPGLTQGLSGATVRLARALYPHTSGEECNMLRAWNDKSETMYNDVITLFDRAIAAEAGEGAGK